MTQAISSSENFLPAFSGITNYEEYSLIQETTEEKKEDGMGTLKKDRTLLLRDGRKMEKLKAKLHTDDDCMCKLAIAVDILMASYFFINESNSMLPCGHMLYHSSFNLLHGHIKV